MKHKLISLAAAVCIILITAVSGFGASVCGTDIKSGRISNIIYSIDYSKQFINVIDKTGILNNSYSMNENNISGNNGSTDISSDISKLPSESEAIINLVNKERNAAGLSFLIENSKLSEAAQAKAEDMMKNGYFSHTSPVYGSPFEMMKTFGISYKTAGENIAKGQKTPAAVMDGWMNSSGHRANILNASYEQIGVGFCRDSNGVTYWVQMFIS